MWFQYHSPALFRLCLTPVLSTGQSSEARVSAPSPAGSRSLRPWSGDHRRWCGTSVRLSPFWLPPTGRLALLRASEAPPLSPLRSPPEKGLPTVGGPFLLSGFLLRVQVPSRFLFSLSAFVLAGYVELFLAPWGVWYPLPASSEVFSGNCSTWGCILAVSAAGAGLRVLLFHHLDSSLYM